MRPLTGALGKLTMRQLARGLLLALAVIIVAVFVVSAIPQAVGADESYVVLSDSMAPSIKAGAVVFVSDVPIDRIQEGDIITYERSGETPVTHRVVDVRTEGDRPEYITKGVANEDPDPSPVPANAVIGSVVFHIPLIGYVVSFANTQLGLITMIVIPALLLVILEIRDFWQATADDEDDQTVGDEKL